MYERKPKLSGGVLEPSSESFWTPLRFDGFESWPEAWSCRHLLHGRRISRGLVNLQVSSKWAYLATAGAAPLLESYSSRPPPAEGGLLLIGPEGGALLSFVCKVLLQGFLQLCLRFILVHCASSYSSQLCSYSQASGQLETRW